MTWDLQALLERVVDADDTTQALERACGIVRDRLQATGAWVHAASAHVLHILVKSEPSATLSSPRRAMR